MSKNIVVCFLAGFIQHPPSPPPPPTKTVNKWTSHPFGSMTVTMYYWDVEWLTHTGHTVQVTFDNGSKVWMQTYHFKIWFSTGTNTKEMLQFLYNYEDHSFSLHKHTERLDWMLAFTNFYALCTNSPVFAAPKYAYQYSQEKCYIQLRGQSRCPACWPSTTPHEFLYGHRSTRNWSIKLLAILCINSFNSFLLFIFINHLHFGYEKHS